MGWLLLGVQLHIYAMHWLYITEVERCYIWDILSSVTRPWIWFLKQKRYNGANRSKATKRSKGMKRGIKYKIQKLQQIINAQQTKKMKKNQKIQQIQQIKKFQCIIVYRLDSTHD